MLPTIVFCVKLQNHKHVYNYHSFISETQYNLQYLSDCTPRLTYCFLLYFCATYFQVQHTINDDLQFLHCNILIKLRIKQNITIYTKCNDLWRKNSEEIIRNYDYSLHVATVLMMTLPVMLESDT